MTGDKQEDSQTNWEDEGGAPAPEPKSKTPKGLEIPTPKRREFKDSLRKMFQPDKPKRKRQR